MGPLYRLNSRLIIQYNIRAWDHYVGLNRHLIIQYNIRAWDHYID